jgi:hypothetical protein
MQVSCFGKWQFCLFKTHSEIDIIKKLEDLKKNPFAMFGVSVWNRTVVIPMGGNCASLLADLFLYSYEADFIQGYPKKNEKKDPQFSHFAT